MEWFQHAENVWHRFTKRIRLIAETESFVVCFESVGREFAGGLHERLFGVEGYLGAVEVDDTTELHWHSYSDALVLKYRIMDDRIAIFYDELNEDPPSEEEMSIETKRLLGIGFSQVKFENCAGHHSIFDRYHNYKHARRIAEWKAKYGDLLGYMVDDVICRLGDAAPDLANRLWAALSTFEAAETDEQYAQVSATCRRIIEYVADMLFPPTVGVREGRKLGESNYRNRLLAYVGEQAASRTNLEVIASSMELFAKHVEKLQDLANKGVHSDVQREGARRCMLRTVLLLDDIISLKPDSFPIRSDLDFSIFNAAGALGDGGNMAN